MKTTFIRATDEVFATQLSQIGRYYNEHESQIIKNKANKYLGWLKIEMQSMWKNDKKKKENL